jgi:hypothetical protein
MDKIPTGLTELLVYTGRAKMNLVCEDCIGRTVSLAFMFFAISLISAKLDLYKCS